ncbi:acyl-CoA dehydrogenase family protein [Streptomyces sp. BK205]|uniref:acyl-CoA dehydrogenase family protein n=1 Tax=Streptomyces sp. BK205 TaxID=2512164 RepID=UPI00140503D4|nr:acyl-CoA dehydrogenase family protein [Streptomyces sp. BK205]
MAGIAAAHAAEADRAATFPAGTISALADEGLLAAVVPRTYGGRGLGPRALTRVALTVARGCGSSAMIWAMHQLQLACLVRHGGQTSQVPAELLSRLVRDDLLLASVTSEKGLGGDLFRSRACVEQESAACRLEKAAPTVSYGEHAGAYLITARRSPSADAEDQVAVIVPRNKVDLTRTGGWNPMGMRATCSPPFLVRAEFDAAHVLSDPFRAVASGTLIPLSQVLWSAVWTGLAAEALGRAARCLRERADRTGSDVVDHRLAWADSMLTGLEAQLSDAADDVEAVLDGRASADRQFTQKLNALKLAASTTTVTVAQHALALCGFLGYQEDGPFSVARMLRDLYSAQIMVSNDRLLDTNAVHAVTLRAPSVS